MFEVTLKPGHPTGSYRRAGIHFTASEPVVLETLPEAVEIDPWLIVKEIDELQARERLQKPSSREAVPAEECDRLLDDLRVCYQRIKTLEDSANDSAQEISRLKTENNALNSGISLLQQQVDARDSRVAELEKLLAEAQPSSTDEAKKEKGKKDKDKE